MIKSITQDDGREVVFANGVKIELLIESGSFLGIGNVSAGPVPWRDGTFPAGISVCNPSGIEFREFLLRDLHADTSGCRLELTPFRRTATLMEWMTHSVRPRRNLPGMDREGELQSDTSIVLTLKPLERRFGRFSAVGFSYSCSYRSRSVPIYRLTDAASWEPGGTAAGNQFWMRSNFAPSVYEFTGTDDFYSTEWYLPSCSNAHPFQFLPFQTAMQGFTFTSGPSGTLVTCARRVSHIRSIFEKARRSGRVGHWHEHCGDLSLDFDTAPMEILWFPGELPQHERHNLYEVVREELYELLHREIGMRRERVSSYGMIEEWGNADLELYAGRGLPALAGAGVRKIGLANHFENNMNVWGVSNMCCTIDFKVAESVGEDKLRDFCRQAAEAGVITEMWGNTSISTLSWLFAQKSGRKARIDFLPETDSLQEALATAEDPFVRNPSGALEADHYAPVFAVLNLCDATVRHYWLQRWAYAAARIGLGGIFLDSSFNLSSDKFHWIQNPGARLSGATADQTALLGVNRPEIEPAGMILSQYHAHLSLMAEMQKIGYEYCNEDLGVFGVHRHGPAVEQRLDSLPLWADCLCVFDADAIARTGCDPDEIFFKGLAFRMVWILFWDIEAEVLSFQVSGFTGQPSWLPSERHIRWLKTFAEVEPEMIEREVLPDDTGVIYRSDHATIFWCFRDLTRRFASKIRVDDRTDGITTDTAETTFFACHVYRLEPAEVTIAAMLRSTV